ncbi:hypothetical protein ACVRYP_05690 [Streptococcus rifensis]
MKIPFELVDGIVLIEVTIDDKKGHMAFDTGAMATCINKHYFLGQQGEEKEIKKFDENLKTSAVIKGTKTISFGDRTLEQIKTLSVDFDYVEKPLRKTKADLVFLGTLGIDVLGQTNIMIDYQNQVIDFDYQVDNGTIRAELPMTVAHLPIIPIQIDGNLHPFVLDTGANTCVIDPVILSQQTEDEINIPHLIWSEREYTHINAVVSDLTQLRQKVKAYGIIGYQVLKDHSWYLDFQNEKILLLA